MPNYSAKVVTKDGKKKNVAILAPSVLEAENGLKKDYKEILSLVREGDMAFYVSTPIVKKSVWGYGEKS